MSFRTKILATLALFMVLVAGLVSVIIISDVGRRGLQERRRAETLVGALAVQWLRANGPALASACGGGTEASDPQRWGPVHMAAARSGLIDRFVAVELRRERGGAAVRLMSDSFGADGALRPEERGLFEEAADAPAGAPIFSRGAVYARLSEGADPAYVGRLQISPLALPPDDLAPAAREVASVMALGAVLLLLVVYVILNRLVLRPIQALSEASERIGRSDFSRPVPPSASYDEVNRMVASFNMMMERMGEQSRRLNEDVRRAEARAHTTERRLVVAQRLSTTGSLAAGIAHEINNPLGGLINAAAALRSGDLSEAKSAEYVELIADGLARIREIVGQILKFTPRPYDKRPADLGDVVDRALALVEHRFRERDVRREWVRSERPEIVEVDAAELQQALLNVVLNALDAVEPGAGRITLRLVRGPDHVRLEVQDNGCGMTAEQLARCTEPFYTTKATGQGSGIGLAVAQSILVNHGGELRVQSDPQDGTCISLVLPRLSPPRGPAPVPSSRHEPSNMLVS